MDEVENIIKELYRIGAILFGNFKLTSGLKSPYYIDLRKAYSHPNILKKIINQYRSKLDKFKYDVIAGIESGSIAIAAILGYQLNKPFIYIRKKPKTYGTMKFIEGTLKEGDQVIIIDDVATTGKNILHAINTIKNLGAEVKQAIVFIDRQQGAAKNLSKEGVNLNSVIKITQIINTLYRYKLIDDDTYKKIRKYVNSQNNFI